MGDNQENRQLSHTMNFYLLGSILMAVCYLTRADEAYGTVRFFACTGLNPPGMCPHNDEAVCENYCKVVESYAERLKNHDRRCPYSLYPLFCPSDDPKECMIFCNTVANYEKR